MGFMEWLNRALYVQVFRNRFVLREIGNTTSTELRPTTDFSTTRLLVGNFAAAEQCLKSELKMTLVANRWLSPSPMIVMHPKEMIEGGLSQVEERVFRELAISCGARKAIVYVGNDLSDAELMNKLRQA